VLLDIEEIKNKIASLQYGDYQELDIILDTIKKECVEFIPNSFSFVSKLDVIIFKPPLWENQDEENSRYHWVNGISILKENIDNISEEVTTSSIFIVHGHDEQLKYEVVDFVRGIGLIPIILHEQPNKGKTIIEKFEEKACGGNYSIVLFSPDDQANTINSEELLPRARQNVIFELGFFYGKIGRGKVSIIYKESKNFDFPSDIQGILYIKYDEQGKWKGKLVKELRSTGFLLNPY